MDLSQIPVAFGVLLALVALGLVIVVGLKIFNNYRQMRRVTREAEEARLRRLEDGTFSDADLKYFDK